jgi:hypothetical protein
VTAPKPGGERPARAPPIVALTAARGSLTPSSSVSVIAHG